jgi:DHA1 family tetracycline resistance protein-like MFS transporter
MDDTQSNPALQTTSLLFLLVMVFLNTMGMSIIAPVVPFLVEQYISDQARLAAMVGWLTSAYAICQFLAAPALGALSDRFGRRPVLRVCLLGSAGGYLLFGLGGALWVLFLGRIIDGITGGNFSILFAYIADRTAPEERGALFGRVGAVAGMGFLLGPAIGGFVARWGYAAPAYLAGAITLAAIVWGYFMLPESLPADRRATGVLLSALNPLALIWRILNIAQLRWLILAGFCYAFPFAGLQTTLSVYNIDILGMRPEHIGLLFLLVGGTDMLVQGVLVGRLLLRFGELRVAIAGFVGVAAGYLVLAAVAYLPSLPLLMLGIVLFAGSGGLVEPSLGGLLSRAAGPQAQGAVQGGGQSVQSLALILSPIWSGWLYTRFGPATPYWSGSLWIGLAIMATCLAIPALAARSQDMQVSHG